MVSYKGRNVKGCLQLLFCSCQVEEASGGKPLMWSVRGIPERGFGK